MAVPTTESLATDYKDLSREMAASRADFAAFREDFAGFRGQVEAHLGFLRWLGAFTAALLVALVGSAMWLSWHASALSLRVEAMGKSSGKVVERLDNIERAVAPPKAAGSGPTPSGK